MVAFAESVNSPSVSAKAALRTDAFNISPTFSFAPRNLGALLRWSAISGVASLPRWRHPPGYRLGLPQTACPSQCQHRARRRPTPCSPVAATALRSVFECMSVSGQCVLSSPPCLLIKQVPGFLAELGALSGRGFVDGALRAMAGLPWKRRPVDRRADLRRLARILDTRATRLRRGIRNGIHV